jgi:hypothetical protein
MMKEISVEAAYTTTIDGLKRAAKGRKIFVSVPCRRTLGGNPAITWVSVSIAAFLRSVSHCKGNSEIDYHLSDSLKSVFIGTEEA